ncbi:AI-2E family transporter [Homoserinimonas sp. A447]
MLIGRRRSEARAARQSAPEELVPRGMLIAGAWSWRILAIAGVAVLFVYLVIQLRLILIPLLVSLLLAALLVPLVQFLQRHRWPKWLAVIVTELGLIGIVTGLVYLVVWQVRTGIPDLQEQSLQAWDDFKQFLLESPLHLTGEQLNAYGDQLWEAIQRDSEVWISGALSFGSTAGHLLAGVLLVLFITLFMLIDGDRIWAWIVRLLPRRARPAISGSGDAGWRTLTQFVKVQIFVAAVDAVGIGIGAFFLGLPLVIPISIAVFLGSFIPIVGAVFTGALAVFVALVYKDLFIALLMLAIVLVVQQVESHVLQPLVMGNAVKVHPVAVVLAVAAGSYIAGIPGALFAVPFVATLNAMVLYIARGTWRSDAPPIRKVVITTRDGDRHA